MSFELIKAVSDAGKKPRVVGVRSGDTVRVTQRIKEGKKERLQTFEGVVIRCDRKKSATSRITVRKVTSGVGVEKSYLLNSPLVEKVEVVKRAKVRRNYLTYLRERSGRSARLTSKKFDKSINDVNIEEPADTTEEVAADEESKNEESK